jgi:hypothetical protein
MKEFYVFLHSGASTELFDNTLNNFSVKLPETINVEGYTCSLVEISIPNSARTLTEKSKDNQLKLNGYCSNEREFKVTVKNGNLKPLEAQLSDKLKFFGGRFYHDGTHYIINLPKRYEITISEKLSWLFGEKVGHNRWKSVKFEEMTPEGRFYRINARPGDVYQIVNQLEEFRYEMEKFSDFGAMMEGGNVTVMFDGRSYYLSTGDFHLNSDLERALNVSYKNGGYRPKTIEDIEYTFTVDEKKNAIERVFTMPSLRYRDDDQILEILKEILSEEVEVKYDNIKKRFGFVVKKGLTLTLSKVVASFLGFGEILNIQGQVYADNSVNYFPLGVNTYVYCSCVEESIVGDCKARILRVIPATNSSDETVIHRKFSVPLRYKVDARELSTISCSLRLDSGSLLPLEGGQSVWVILKFQDES